VRSMHHTRLCRLGSSYVTAGTSSSDRRRRSISDSGHGHYLEASYDSIAGNARARSRSLASRAGASVRGMFGLSSSLPIGPFTIWTDGSDYAADVQAIYKRRITTLYISFSSLKSYIELNHSGFSKILKK